MNRKKSYHTFLGATLIGFSATRSAIGLDFFKKDGRKNVHLSLSSMADICFSEDQLFIAYSKFDVINPAFFANIYSCLDSPVISFEPLGLSRACRLEFSEAQIFCWAEKDGLPDCLFMADKKIESQKTEWWLIDDE